MARAQTACGLWVGWRLADRGAAAAPRAAAGFAAWSAGHGDAAGRPPARGRHGRHAGRRPSGARACSRSSRLPRSSARSCPPSHQGAARRPRAARPAPSSTPSALSTSARLRHFRNGVRARRSAPQRADRPRGGGALTPALRGVDRSAARGRRGADGSSCLPPAAQPPGAPASSRAPTSARASRPTSIALIGRVLVLDDLRHSYVDLQDPAHLEFRYTRLVADVVAMLPRAGPVRAPASAAGGSRCRATWPPCAPARAAPCSSSILEVVAFRPLDCPGCAPARRCACALGDARVSLGREPRGRYDVDVIATRSGGGRAVPLAPHDAARVPRRRTARPAAGDPCSGNVIETREPPLAFARAQSRTCCGGVRPPPPWRWSRPGRAAKVSGTSSWPPSTCRCRCRRARRAARAPSRRALTGPALDRFMGDARVLRDAFAPVDQLRRRRLRALRSGVATAVGLADGIEGVVVGELHHRRGGSTSLHGARWTGGAEPVAAQRTLRRRQNDGVDGVLSR